MKTNSLPSSINYSNSVLFLGAGFSYGSHSSTGKAIPSVTSLISDFLDLASISADREDYDLEMASQAAFDGDEGKLLEYISENFRAQSSDDYIDKITKMDWKRVYTTNYDDLFEFSCRKNNIPYSTLIINDPFSPKINDGRQIVHIHGSVDKVSSESFRSDFFLTDEQGRNIKFLDSPWKNQFFEDLTYASSVFFIGFSAADFHIRQILDSGRHLKEKFYFVTSTRFSAPLQKRLEMYGMYFPIGIEGFSHHLDFVEDTSNDEVTNPDCLIELDFPKDSNDLFGTLDQVRDEFLIGTNSPSMHTGKSPKEGGYFVNRLNERKYLEVLEKRGCVVFHSDVGNGKTNLALQLASNCFRRGKRAYKFNGRNFNNSDTLKFIGNLDNCVIVVENLSRNANFINYCRKNNKNILFICTERTKILEVYFHAFSSKIGDCERFDINKLSNHEIAELKDLLDHNLLWGGDFSHLKDSEKMDFIKSYCTSELRGVLFALFDGGSLAGRINEIFERFQNLPKDYNDLVLLSCLLNYAYTKFEIDRHLYNLEDLLDLRLDYNSVMQQVENEDGIISEFINIKDFEISFKSSIFAKYYISSRVDIDYVFDLVYRVLKNLEKTFSHFDKELYEDFSKSLMRFNLYRQIYSKNSAKDGRIGISRNKFHESVNKFYDKCRLLKISINDPLFVIQISMASMDNGNFERCLELIDTARAMKRPSFDSYQIDTHHAEVLIRYSYENGISNSFIRENEAFSLLQGVINRRNERYHPFGVFDKMIDLFEKRRNELGKNSQYASVTLERMISLTDKFPNELRDRYHIINRVRFRAGKLRNSF